MTGIQEKIRSPRGRKKDETKDASILEAAIAMLAEVGFDGMTMDAVAERAGAGKTTVYRRWSSKHEMMLEAIRGLKNAQVDPASLPDTGSLRGDLLAIFVPASIEETGQKLKLMASLSTLFSQHPQFATEGNTVITELWASVNEEFLKRAILRGEISPAIDLETAAQVVPAMATYRVLAHGQPFDRAFLLSVIDGILLPALRQMNAFEQSGQFDSRSSARNLNA